MLHILIERRNQMNKTRQDAWTKDEDILLAETVLRFIRNGETQLDAFKQIAEQLSRTSAACGFRWNATVRKQHVDAIKIAKETRKKSLLEQVTYGYEQEDSHTIETAISMLEKVRENSNRKNSVEQEGLLTELKAANLKLESKIQRYEQAWTEMNKLWQWIENREEH